MKLVHPVSVAITLTDLTRYEPKMLYVEKGEQIIQVECHYEQIRDMYEWLSENDRLTSLVRLAPDLLSNQADIEHAQMNNAVRSSRNGSGGPLQPFHPSYTPIPELEVKAVWLFRDKDSAMLFKLTFGGSL